MAEISPENAALAQRRPALNEGTRARQGVSIRMSPALTRFSLRLAPGSAAADREAAGFQLDMPINQFRARGDRWSARLGPNEWLIGGPEGRTEAIATEVEAALDGHIHALVDVSHRSVAIEVSGFEATAVLNAGCPLDLSIKAFPGGSATRTLLGKAEIVLIRPDEETIFRIECWRSFARYVHDFLVEAARDFPPVP